MSFIDRRIRPDAALSAGIAWQELIEFAQRCPDCPPIARADFSALRRPLPSVSHVAPSEGTEPVERSVQEARHHLRTVVDDAQINRKPTVITRHGLRAAVVIPPEWFEELLRYRENAGHDDSTSSR